MSFKNALCVIFGSTQALISTVFDNTEADYGNQLDCSTASAPDEYINSTTGVDEPNDNTSSTKQMCGLNLVPTGTLDTSKTPAA